MRRIIIFSDAIDRSTSKVMSYIEELTVRIHSHELHYIYEIANWNSANSIWLRRGNFPTFHIAHLDLLKERKKLRNFIHFILERQFYCLGSLIREYEHNKLIDLFLADQCGLRIPEFYIVSSGNPILKTKENFNEIIWITKAIGDVKEVDFKGYRFFGGFTNQLDFDYCENEFPSLIQEYIAKSFEIRSFFIENKFYSMAIFSQKNEKTKIDFRNYDIESPNRNIPFQLPHRIENKLKKLMNELKLNTGSIDLICSSEGEFVFLEVNPCGQFDWLSVDCNYYLEHHIAQILMNEAA